jgi:hypothetical protein
MKDFRANLNRVATFFAYEPVELGPRETLPQFRAKLRGKLIDLKEKRFSGQRPEPKLAAQLKVTLSLRPAFPLSQPARPYPLLEPYDHPATFGGRSAELAELRRRVLLKESILGIYALSGAGKSSLLIAGFIPQLFEEGVPVAFDRTPAEAGLTGRLIGQLLEFSSGQAPIDLPPDEFTKYLQQCGELSGRQPILILDQFEDLLKDTNTQRFLGRLGPIMAATVQTNPVSMRPVCRWILCYRQDFHGEVANWLGDVLRIAAEQNPILYDRLPFNLREHGRFQAWPLPLFGEPLPGIDSRSAATAAFLDAILKPLKLLNSDSAKVYPWIIPDEDAQRLAEAFANARLARPRAPLVPELQVVLNHLLEQARPAPDSTQLVTVPQDVGDAIDRALENHLNNALSEAFPATRDESCRKGRTRALLALRQLADAEGRRATSLTEKEILAALGPDGSNVLEKLSAPNIRLIVPETEANGLRYSLPHDRIAVMITEALSKFALRTQYNIDENIVNLRNFVIMRSEFYEQSGDDHALRISRLQAKQLREFESVLITSEAGRRWWYASKKRAQVLRQRTVYTTSIVLLLSGLAWWIADRHFHLFEHIPPYDKIASAELQVRKVDDFVYVNVNGTPVIQAKYGVPSEWKDVRRLLKRGANIISIQVRNGQYGGCSAILAFRLNKKEFRSLMKTYEVPIEKAYVNTFCTGDSITLNLE